MEFRVRLQLAEAFGPVNRWFCSQASGRQVDDKESLLIYYIRNGGAEDFAKRYSQAMGPQNRWYCSEFYRRDIRDPEILWKYYVNRTSGPAVTKHSRHEPSKRSPELSLAC